MLFKVLILIMKSRITNAGVITRPPPRGCLQGRLTHIPDQHASISAKRNDVGSRGCGATASRYSPGVVGAGGFSDLNRLLVIEPKQRCGLSSLGVAGRAVRGVSDGGISSGYGARGADNHSGDGFLKR